MKKKTTKVKVKLPKFPSTINGKPITLSYPCPLCTQTMVIEFAKLKPHGKEYWFVCDACNNMETVSVAVIHKKLKTFLEKQKSKRKSDV